MIKRSKYSSQAIKIRFWTIKILIPVADASTGYIRVATPWMWQSLHASVFTGARVGGPQAWSESYFKGFLTITWQKAMRQAPPLPHASYATGIHNLCITIATLITHKNWCSTWAVGGGKHWANSYLISVIARNACASLWGSGQILTLLQRLRATGTSVKHSTSGRFVCPHCEKSY